MNKIYDFSTGLSFEALSESFDCFHDWVIQEFKVFSIEDGENASIETEHQYDAEVILNDPYKRFEKTRVLLRFENVNSASVQGLSLLGSELDGISYERTPTGVMLTSTDGDFLRMEAEKLTFGFT
jgi:hypothetical protein